MTDVAAPSASPTVEPAAPPPPRSTSLWVLVAVFGGALAVHVATSLAQGTLVPTLQGVLLGPSIVSLGLLLVLGVVRSARAGRRREAVATVVVIALAVWPVLGGGLARVMLFPGSAAALPPAGLIEGGPAEVVDLGGGLRGAFVRGEGPGPRPVLVFFHGNAHSAMECVGLARRFATLDVDVLVAEYRGFGGCPGSPTEAGLLDDARAALAAAERLTGVPSREHVLVGLSLGTGVAAAMAAEGHGRAVVLLAPYTSITDVAARFVPPWLASLAVRDPFDSRARLAGATQPVTILHGTADRVIPFALGKALAESLGRRGTLVALPGLDHNDLFDDMRPVLAVLGHAARPHG